MALFNEGEFVKTTRLSPKDTIWEVIQTQGNQVQLRNCVTKEITWLYDAHCYVDVALKRRNLSLKLSKKKTEVDKLLATPRRKR